MKGRSNLVRPEQILGITVEAGDKQVSELTDHAQTDNGDSGTYRAVYIKLR